MAETVDWREVEAAWREADRDRRGEESTLGIFAAVESLVERWTRETLTPATLGALYLIGGDGVWEERSRGTLRVSECDAPAPLAGGRSCDALGSLIAVEAHNSPRRVLVDGNHRAVALWHALQAPQGGMPPPAVPLYVGRLRRRFALAAEAVSTLWRPRR